jgi:chorismate mutase/prephenate dehydratase
MSAVTSLSELRDQIDKIDAEILQLINRRAGYAKEIALTKIASGETGTFYRPDRESLVLRRINELNPGPLSSETVMRFFRELMSACLALEKPLEVAFLGPEGTFSQQAAYKHFGHAISTISVASINEIFTAVELDRCHFGVVPVENSTEGVINHTLDRFLSSTLKICGEVELKVHQNLMGHVRNLAEVTEVMSHQQSLAQCRSWLNKHLPDTKLTAVASNAEAARMASNNKTILAIAGAVAAEVYQLPIIETNIEDEPNNTTRFIVIGQQASAPTGKDKTSLVISTGNQPGALYRALEPFAHYGIGMVSIESRPSRQGLWDYVFFIDLDGHIDDPNVAEAIKMLKANANMLKLLGSYPKAAL